MSRRGNPSITITIAGLMLIDTDVLARVIMDYMETVMRENATSQEISIER